MNIKRVHNITGDYYGEMNSAIFMKWVETQLLPGLRPASTVIMDNASYHSVKEQDTKPPTSASRKEEMKIWLHTRNISFDQSKFQQNHIKT